MNKQKKALKKFHDMFMSVMKGEPVKFGSDFNPDNKPSDGAKVACVIGDDVVKNLYRLSHQIMEYVEDYGAAHGLDTVPGIRKQTIDELQGHQRHLESVIDLFHTVSGMQWYLVRLSVPERFMDISRPQLSLYEGWKVVVSETAPDPVPQGEEVLSMLMSALQAGKASVVRIPGL